MSAVKLPQHHPIPHRDLFLERMPTKPYCCDCHEEGLKIRPKKTAIKYRHIQHNSPAFVSYLAFDIDHALAWFSWKDEGLPSPHWIALNPENGHCHIVYALKTPVTRTSAAKVKPLQWLAMIEGCLKIRLGADQGYSGLITKNPLHSDWDVHWFDHVEPYELAYLDEFCLDKHKEAYYKTLQRKETVTGLGRNCSVFDEARKWAYSAVREFWRPNGYENWLNAVEAHCRGLNYGFSEPLAVNECKGIAKSIAKWVWNRFNPSAFRESQAKLGAKGGKVSKGGGRPSNSGKTKTDLLPKVLALKAQGFSNRDIAEDLGISSSTVSLYLKRDPE